jgi:hypothetical protein
MLSSFEGEAVKDIIPVIKLTDSLCEMIYCIINLEETGQHRYSEAKKQLNASIEDLIDELQKRRATRQ